LRDSGTRDRQSSDEAEKRKSDGGSYGTAHSARENQMGPLYSGTFRTVRSGKRGIWRG
jgi:hypothetical protein